MRRIYKTVFICFFFRSNIEDSFESEVDSVEGTSDAVKNARNGRFLVYWMTTTSVSTSTSYTSTLTIGSLTCTPKYNPLTVCANI